MPAGLRRRADIDQVLGSDGADIADLESALGQQRGDRMHIDMTMLVEPGRSSLAHRPAEINEQQPACWLQDACRLADEGRSNGLGR